MDVPLGEVQMRKFIDLRETATSSDGYLLFCDQNQIFQIMSFGAVGILLANGFARVDEPRHAAYNPADAKT